MRAYVPPRQTCLAGGSSQLKSPAPHEGGCIWKAAAGCFRAARLYLCLLNAESLIRFSSGELLSQHYFADALTLLSEDGGRRAQQRSWQASRTRSSAWSSHEEMLPEGRPVRVSQPTESLQLLGLRAW